MGPDEFFELSIDLMERIENGEADTDEQLQVIVQDVGGKLGFSEAECAVMRVQDLTDFLYFMISEVTKGSVSN